ncbi:four-carbon acid sugar kinase family protein [Sphingobacterium suaedae]|uniref:Four-carbon acid sugar kinase family protein n=1 Tax=Sphingobacterium suaedae TaxID=1686402 RepID=A0ABW5KQ57_9SPHI
MKPILVIADDLTGAAEIGGVALRYGLSAQIVHSVTEPITTDILIVNTNSRSMKIDRALSHLASVLPSQSIVDWSWIYLKFDSALRGHMREEIPFYKTAFCAQQVFFCPVNPKMGRLIRNGVYVVQGVPIAETDFKHDPEFPVRESDILQIMGPENWALQTEPKLIPDDRFFLIPAVAEGETLDRWADCLPKNALFAGAAAFFEALLRNRLEHGELLDSRIDAVQGQQLYICGSKHESSLRRLRELAPEEIVYWQKAGGEWHVAQELEQALRKKERVVFAVATDTDSEARVIRKSMATSIAMLNEQYALQELVIEGGATARAVLKALQIDALRPIQEKGAGVITCAVPDTEIYVTLKPGSYPWTKELWAF